MKPKLYDLRDEDGHIIARGDREWCFSALRQLEGHDIEYALTHLNYTFRPTEFCTNSGPHDMEVPF